MLLFSFVFSTANSSLLGGGGGKCLVFYNMFIVALFLSMCEMFGGFFRLCLFNVKTSLSQVCV